jgi:hypothetical protein
MRILIFEADGCTDLAPRAFFESEGHDVVGVTRSLDEAVRLARATGPDLALVLSYDGGTDDAVLLIHTLGKAGVPTVMLNCGAQEEKSGHMSSRWLQDELRNILAKHKRDPRADDDDG